MLLHHANQLLVTDGYTHRDGITPVADAVVELVRLHERLAVPTSLHLSGTLIEALAWHRPDVLDLVKALTAEGLLEAVGGAYGEPVLPVISERAVARHLRVTAEVMERHLDVVPTSAWVPERVWTPRTGQLLADAGYTRTALDDRLLLPPGERAAFDATGPWHTRPTALREDLCRPVLDASSGLVVAPITSALRYLVPPRGRQDLDLLAELTAPLGPDDVLVYADDLERTCGVAGWEPAMERYEQFLTWLAGTSGLIPTRLDELTTPTGTTQVHAGTYYELAHDHGAGEDYLGWSADPRWAPYAAIVDGVEHDVDAAPPDDRATALAERLLLVAQHETAWQDVAADGQRAPAPWACATASHARDARPVLHAGRWARAGGCEPTATVVDVDGDGTDELVLADRDIWCLISPQAGGRLTLVAVREDDQARVIVGNALDHWNFQSESHRFMQQPPAHPGAFAAHDAENAAWTVELVESDAHAARAVLSHGPAVRRIAVTGGRVVLCSQGTGPQDIESLLLPDYLETVRAGRSAMTVEEGPGWAAVRQNGAATWTGWGHDGRRAQARYGLAAHGLPVAVSGTGHLDLLIGTGPLPGHIAREIDGLSEGLHRPRLLLPVGTQG